MRARSQTAHHGTPRHTAVHHGPQQHTMAHRSTPRHTVAHHGPPQHTTAHRSTPRPTATHHSPPQYTTAHRSTPRHTVAHHSPPQYTTTHHILTYRWSWRRWEQCLESTGCTRQHLALPPCPHCTRRRLCRGGSQTPRRTPCRRSAPCWAPSLGRTGRRSQTQGVWTPPATRTRCTGCRCWRSQRGTRRTPTSASWAECLQVGEHTCEVSTAMQRWIAGA
jgi:hypothetical protein